ncbi:MAG: FISUMP domain-containing protein [Candidatus Falkowbacteria bacterium]
MRFIKTSKFVSALLFTMVATLFFSILSQTMLAATPWIAPTGAALSYNIGSPLFVNSSAQSKIGGLTVGTTGSSTTYFSSLAGSRLYNTSTIPLLRTTSSTITKWFDVGNSSFVVAQNSAGVYSTSTIGNSFQIVNTSSHISFQYMAPGVVTSTLIWTGNNETGFFAGRQAAMNAGIGSIKKDGNIAIGYASLAFLSTGINNTVMGLQAGNPIDTESNNTGIGANSLYTNSGIIGDNNVAIGNNAGSAFGTSNTFIGRSIFASLSQPNQLNVAVGYMAGGNNQSQGDKNTYIGNNAKSSFGVAHNVTLLGQNAQSFASSTTVIGGSAQSTRQNSIILGNGATVTTYVGIGSSSPSRRLTVDGGTNPGINTDGVYYKSGVAGITNTLAASTSAVSKCIITFRGGLITGLSGTCPKFPCGQTYIDARDGNTYPTVQIGSQCWMAKNLAYLPSVSACTTASTNTPVYYVYGYNGVSTTVAKAQANYTTYGVLYNFTAAKAACPTGTHYPTFAEYNTLSIATGNNVNITGNAVMSSSSWSGTNSSGFNALAGGWCIGGASFANGPGSGSLAGAFSNEPTNQFRFTVLNSPPPWANNVSDSANSPYAYSLRCIVD